MMKPSNFLFLFLTVFLICGCISESFDKDHSGSKLSVGDTLPPFSAVTASQDTITRELAQGKTLVILFFHTECSDCQKELPVVEQVYRELQNDSLWQLICIGREEAADKVLRYWNQNGLTMPVSPQKDRLIYDRFAYSGVPMLYVVNAQSVICALYDDQHMTSYEELKNQILKVNEENKKAGIQTLSFPVY